MNFSALVQGKMSLFHLYFWRMFLLVIEFWVNSSYPSPAFRWSCSIVFWPPLPFFFLDPERECGEGERENLEEAPCWVGSLMRGSVPNPEILSDLKSRVRCSNHCACQVPLIPIAFGRRASRHFTLSLCVTSLFFPSYFWCSLSLCGFWQFGCDVGRCGYFCVYLAWVFSRFWICGLVFFRFQPLFLQIFFCPSLLYCLIF